MDCRAQIYRENINKLLVKIHRENSLFGYRQIFKQDLKTSTMKRGKKIKQYPIKIKKFGSSKVRTYLCQTLGTLWSMPVHEFLHEYWKRNPRNCEKAMTKGHSFNTYISGTVSPKNTVSNLTDNCEYDLT